MEQKNKIFLIILTALLLGGCGQTVDHKGKTPLVQVGNEFLYKEDLRAAMPVGLKGQDSIQFAERYIRTWVEDALLFHKAEGNVPDNLKLEELVASYRKALIVHAYQEELVNQQLGDSIDEAEIEQYYQQNPTLFRATQPYVQGLFIKVPVKAPHLGNVRTWYKQNTQDAVDRLLKYSIGNAVSYDYFYDRWLPVSDLAAKIPLKELDTDFGYLEKKKNVEVRDTAFCYFLHVEHFLPEGEQLPLEYARTEIKEILINLKRVEFINRVKQDLYNEASEDKDIIYYN